MRKLGNIESGSVSISSFSLHFLFISSFSLHFLAARLPGCHNLCNPVKNYGLNIKCCQFYEMENGNNIIIKQSSNRTTFHIFHQNLLSFYIDISAI